MIQIKKNKECYKFKQELKKEFRIEMITIKNILKNAVHFSVKSNQIKFKKELRFEMITI